MKIKIKTDQFEGIELNEVKEYEDLTPLQQFCVDEGYDCFEEVEEFEEGDWVKNGHGKTMFRYHSDDITQRYGFNFSGDWRNEIGSAYDDNLKKATTEEIKEALTKEAKQRGYKSGKNIISWIEGDNSIVGIGTTEGFEYQPAIDCLALGNTWIYKKGQWAEIYKKGQWAELIDENIEINGKTIEVEEGTVKISCGDTIDKEMYKNFYAVVNKYDLEVSRKGEQINEQLQQIWDRLIDGQNLIADNDYE